MLLGENADAPALIALAVPANGPGQWFSQDPSFSSADCWHHES